MWAGCDRQETNHTNTRARAPRNSNSFFSAQPITCSSSSSNGITSKQHSGTEKVPNPQRQHSAAGGPKLQCCSKFTPRQRNESALEILHFSPLLETMKLSLSRHEKPFQMATCKHNNTTGNTGARKTAPNKQTRGPFQFSGNTRCPSDVVDNKILQRRFIAVFAGFRSSQINTRYVMRPLLRRARDSWLMKGAGRWPAPSHVLR